MAKIDFYQLTGAQKKILRETLMGVFGSPEEMDIFLQENDYGPLNNFVKLGRLPHQVFDVIQDFVRTGQLERFVADVRSEYPEAPVLRDLEMRLGFADEEASSQRVVRGIGLEKIVRDAGFADLNLWAERLSVAGRRVCCIAYDHDGRNGRGTGFLVSKDLVLTNYHVIEDVLKGLVHSKHLRVRFDYAATPEGLSGGQTFALAQNWIVASSGYSQSDLEADPSLPSANELDFVLIRLEGAVGEEDGPSGKRGWVDLGDATGPARDDSILFILQHPDGRPLKQSIGIRKASQTPLRLRYDADTYGGSSGSLVLDQHLAPVALHQGCDAEYNQGIPLTLIREVLKKDPRVERFWGLGK